MTERSVISDAENKGIAKGRAEGKIEGRAEGEHSKSLEIAGNMLKKGLSISDIQEFTGLSEQDIAKLSSSQQE